MPQNQFIEQLYLVASNDTSPQPGPAGYDLLGYWDVDAGGSHGTGGTSGTDIMALYAKRADLTSFDTVRIDDIMLTSSNNATPVPPAGPGPAYMNIGYWDVDQGGAVGTNGTRGSFMTGLYTRFTCGIARNELYISDIMLTASDNNFPSLPAATYTNASNYRLVGYWDVDAGGGVGTDGSKGSFMMGMFVQLTPFTPPPPVQQQSTPSYYADALRSASRINTETADARDAATHIIQNTSTGPVS